MLIMQQHSQTKHNYNLTTIFMANYIINIQII